MTPPTTLAGTGVRTNGIGKVTTAHLNLTRTMADVVREEGALEEEVDAPAEPVAPAKIGRPKGPREPKRFPFAGFDPHEGKWEKLYIEMRGKS